MYTNTQWNCLNKNIKEKHFMIYFKICNFLFLKKLKTDIKILKMIESALIMKDIKEVLIEKLLVLI